MNGQPTAALVLPPNESFSPEAAGAIGLLVHRIATAPSAFRQIVIGPEPRHPLFPDAAFRPARMAWRVGDAARYAAGVAAVCKAERPGVIEIHGRPDIARRVAALCAPTPCVLFLHNDPQAMRAARTPRARAALVRRMGAVAVVSDFLRGRFEAGLPARPRMLFVIPNALSADPLQERLHAEQRDHTILFAGRMVADKGADVFVRACAAALPFLPGWRALMVGADRFGPDSPETPFLAALRPLAAQAGVELLGYRPHAAVQALMARAAIVAVPSRWPEPFGLVALEALASGAALICTRQGALPEIADDAAHYAAAGDAAALAAAIRALAASAPQRQALADAGLKRLSRFSLAATMDRLDAMRQQLLRPRDDGTRPEPS